MDEIVLPSKIRMNDVDKITSIIGKITSIRKSNRMKTNISYDCLRCGNQIVLKKEKPKMICNSCGNERLFRKLDEKIIFEQKILVDGFRVYIRNEELIEEIKKMRRGQRIKVKGLVKLDFRKGYPFGRYCIFASSIEVIE